MDDSTVEVGEDDEGDGEQSWKGMHRGNEPLEGSARSRPTVNDGTAW
jgi:hypothetical protein